LLLTPQEIALTVRVNRTNRERQKLMRKITKPAKSLFGPLVATALMSVVAAKFLSEFASAADVTDSSPSSTFQEIGPDDLAGDARFIGAYKVTQIDSKKGSSTEDLCKNPSQSNANCSQEVWAYNKENQLILIKALSKNDLTTNSFSVFSLDGNCKTDGNLAEALENGVFSLGLCSASGGSGTQSLGGTIGLSAGNQSLDLPAGTLYLPGTDSQGEIKISKNSISIHKYTKKHKGLSPAYDDTYILMPVSSSR
jgi:hypothetical protein